MTAKALIEKLGKYKITPDDMWDWYLGVDTGENRETTYHWFDLIEGLDTVALVGDEVGYMEFQHVYHFKKNNVYLRCGGELDGEDKVFEGGFKEVFPKQVIMQKFLTKSELKKFKVK